MAELLSGDRLKFPKSIQKRFLINCREKLNFSKKEMSKILGISTRTLSDWEKEKYFPPQNIINFLSKETGIKIPKSKIIERFWYTKVGAKKGGNTLYKKHGVVGGDAEKRKQAWYEWWNKEGRFKRKDFISRKYIRRPKKSTPLAEFVGILLGDGGITKHQVTITLNTETDRAYILYTKHQIEKLFGITPSVRKEKKFKATNIVISRTELVDYLKFIGMKIGNKIKQQVDIPDWIKENKKFMLACVRGLVDTDGSVFLHKYTSGGKIYKYKKIDFSSSSKPLLNSVFIFLKKEKLNPRITKNGKGLRIESIETVKKYMAIVKTSNPKHLKRYLE